MKRSLIFGVAALVVGLILRNPQPSDGFQETRTRDLILKDFLQARPGGQAAPKKMAPAPASVGVTLWRVREAISSDPASVRGLIHPLESNDDAKEWVAERVSMQSPMTEGQRVRLGIESARRGYLYVVDRDGYADGSMSAPTLIFPTSRLRAGDNRVEPGVVIEIPDAQDRPAALQLKKTRSNQNSLILTLIVSPEPIREIRLSRSDQTLAPEKLAQWEKLWSSKTQTAESSSSIGKLYTPVEQKAAQANPRPFGPKDAAPTMLIEAAAPRDRPILVSLTLKVE